MYIDIILYYMTNINTKLVSPSGMVETPRLQAKKVLAKWPREWP